MGYELFLKARTGFTRRELGFSFSFSFCVFSYMLNSTYSCKCESRINVGTTTLSAAPPHSHPRGFSTAPHSQLLQICTSSKPRLPPGHVLSPHSFAAFFLGQVPWDGFGGCCLFFCNMAVLKWGKFKLGQQAIEREMKRQRSFTHKHFLSWGVQPPQPESWG